MFRLEQKYGADVGEDYFDLFETVFGEIDRRQRPALVFTGYEDERPVGFAAGYMVNATDFYIQYYGATPEIRGTGKTLEYTLLALETLDLHFRGVLFAVAAENVAMLKLAMDLGFRICGARTDCRAQTVYVEFLREGRHVL